MSHSRIITEQQKALVKSTWSQIEPISDQAATLFYKNLFEINPSVESLFVRTDLSAQKMKLVHAISAVVSSLDRIEQMLPLLKELGQRHTDYGVKDSHYDDVGKALIEALRIGLGENWTESIRKAWLETYTIVSNTMRSGAHRN